MIEDIYYWTLLVPIKKKSDSTKTIACYGYPKYDYYIHQKNDSQTSHKNWIFEK